MSICLHRRCTQPANPSRTPAVGQHDGLKQQTVLWRCAVAAQLSICGKQKIFSPLLVKISAYCNSVWCLIHEQQKQSSSWTTVPWRWRQHPPPKSRCVVTMKKTYSLTNTVVKVKVTLEQAMAAQSWCRIYVYSFFGLGVRWMVNATPRPLYSREKDPVPIVRETWWAPESVWTGAECVKRTGLRFADRPARSESLYRLSCCGPHYRYC